jgi:hypothetical protein
MKKLFILLLTILCLSGAGQLTSANSSYYDPSRDDAPPPPAGHHDRVGRPGPRRRLEARRVLDKTGAYLKQAQLIAPRPELSRLGRAFAYQRKASICYRQCRYDRAIRLSLRAREIARKIIARLSRGRLF